MTVVDINVGGNAVKALHTISNGFNEVSTSCKRAKDGHIKNTRVLQRYDAQTKKTIVLQQQLQRVQNRSSRGFIKGFHKEWKTTGASMKKTGGIITGVRGKMAGLAGSLKGQIAGFAGATLGIMALVAAGRKLIQWVGESIQKFRQFQDRVAEVSTILQGLDKQIIPSLESGIVHLAVKFGKSATDLTKGLYDILSAAFDAKDSINLLNTATKASIAGLTDVSTSVDVFTSILNAYGMTAAQATNISDVLFQTVVRGKLIFSDLASSMGYITPIAANAGVEFREIAAALATVTRQGLHVDMASRGLALMIQGIINPTTAAADAAQEYGVEMSGLALRVKGLEGFIHGLNEATTEYGMSVLPKMVRNMRSLRVAMALAGEEGVVGFTKDLELMATATGRTDDALVTMMNTQKRSADILASSMELVERKIGEAWSSTEIEINKIKLWWATLFTGGDADQVTKDFDNQVNAIKASYVKLMTATAVYEGKGTLWDTLLAAPSGKSIEDAMRDEVDFDAISKYFEMQDELMDLGKTVTELNNIRFAMESLPALDRVFSPGMLLSPALSYYSLLIDSFKNVATTIPDEELTKINPILEANGVEALKAGTSYAVFATKLQQVSEDADKNATSMAELQAELSALEPDVNYLTAAFDDGAQSIQKHKLNILELQNALKDLRMDVEDVYTALSGDKFIGKLDYEISIKIDETKLDRFEKFSSMATKYWEDAGGTGYLNQYIDMYGELDAELASAIGTIYQYNQAVEEQKKAEMELQEELDETLRLIRKNNLEKMKLQLIGMLRRRGNTRAEQRMMKRLDMENLKLRIDNMTKEIALEDEFATNETDIRESQYEAAKRILDEYIDSERHNLWLIKDIRDDEIADLAETIQNKKDQLKLYTDWYNDELQALEDENSAYIESLEALAKLAPDLYAKMFDTTYLDEWIRKFEEYKELAGLTTTVSNKDKLNTKLKKHEGFQNIRASIPSKMKEVFKERRIPGFYQRGTHYIPSEGTYHLHRGEQVVPQGKSSGGDNFNISIKVAATVNNDYDVERLAAKLGESLQTELSNNKTGKSKYHMR